MTALPWVHSDGGRAEAGFKGDTGDCVTRAIAIALGLPYRDVYDALHERQRLWLATRRKPRVTRSGRAVGASPRLGVYREAFGPWLAERGWTHTPTMAIGSGCRVHLAAGELPTDRGPLIANLSKHVAAVLPDGRGGMAVLDTHDPTRDGTRCVYGYWSKEPTDG